MHLCDYLKKLEKYLKIVDSNWTFHMLTNS